MYSLLVSLHSLIKYFKDPFCLSYFRHMFTLPTYNARRANKFNHNIYMYISSSYFEKMYIIIIIHLSTIAGTLLSSAVLFEIDTITK